jgi:sulfopyruvate decarboxylase TPP-binding subunit
MRKVIAILPVVSAIYPMITGATAPPTIVMISNEEANLVFVPASLNASENIVGNMILSPRYRAKNAMRDKVPLHSTTQSIITMLCLKKKKGLLSSITEK